MKVLAMYDVRGIQNYIFRTSKIKEIIGASAIIENILEDALRNACDMQFDDMEKHCRIRWHNDQGVFHFADDADVEVLFIGGGNATVLYSSRELCVAVNRKMSKFITERSYSMQLAVAIVEKTDNYSNDYQALMRNLLNVKDTMVPSNPLGALPVMQAEIKTGFPAVERKDIAIGTETLLKQKASNLTQDTIKSARILDNYITQKGRDSLLAVVHIDGNSMALRIRNMISDITDYTEAVETMRNISFNISKSYNDTMNSMQAFFEKNAKGVIPGNSAEFFVRKIISAGDDITYVCNANIAVASFEYFAKSISRKTLNGKTDADSLRKYGFSVCGGIAFMGAHFPFDIAYDVAEECCDSAKRCAKRKENRDGNRIGNYFDFQYCRNVQTRDLDSTREREYRTHSGESLLIRPYYVETENDGNLNKAAEKNYSFEKLRNSIHHFQNEQCMPRSFSKELRNKYALGTEETMLFYSFLRSRGWMLPEKGTQPYDEDGTALYYDAVEIMDNYIDLGKFGEEIM